MARARRRNEREPLGRLQFAADGKPLAYRPDTGNGVGFRIRDLEQVERLYMEQKISESDLIRARGAFQK